MENECSVCLESSYLQNDALKCAHDLCQHCYNRLIIKKCPICRSFNQYKFIKIELSIEKNAYVREQNLTKYVLYSYEFSNLMRRHIKNRRRTHILLKANKYLRYNSFIIHKNQHLVLGGIYNIFHFILYNNFSIINKQIIEQYLHPF